MADSKVQKIADQIVARMRLINPDDANYADNGFQTAIGVRCEDSRQNWDENELPATSVFEGTTNTVESNDNRRQSIHLTAFRIETQLVAEDDAGEKIKAVRKAVSDIKRAIRLDERWKVEGVGLAMVTREKSSGPVYTDANQFEIAAAFVEIEVQSITQKFNSES